MSHFAVIVIGENWEKQLAPYSEELQIEPYLDEDGEETSYNPKSRWDWYVIGGRWTGYFPLKNGTKGIIGRPGILTKPSMPGFADQARFCDIQEGEIKTPFAFVKEGKWYERGEMGWWACVSDEKPMDEWEAEFRRMLITLSEDTLLTLVDCHI